MGESIEKLREKVAGVTNKAQELGEKITTKAGKATSSATKAATKAASAKGLRAPKLFKRIFALVKEQSDRLGVKYGEDEQDKVEAKRNKLKHLRTILVDKPSEFAKSHLGQLVSPLKPHFARVKSDMQKLQEKNDRILSEASSVKEKAEKKMWELAQKNVLGRSLITTARFLSVEFKNVSELAESTYDRLFPESTMCVPDPAKTLEELKQRIQKRKKEVEEMEKKRMEEPEVVPDTETYAIAEMRKKETVWGRRIKYMSEQLYGSEAAKEKRMKVGQNAVHWGDFASGLTSLACDVGVLPDNFEAYFIPCGSEIKPSPELHSFSQALLHSPLGPAPSSFRKRPRPAGSVASDLEHADKKSKVDAVNALTSLGLETTLPNFSPPSPSSNFSAQPSLRVRRLSPAVSHSQVTTFRWEPSTKAFSSLTVAPKPEPSAISSKDQAEKQDNVASNPTKSVARLRASKLPQAARRAAKGLRHFSLLVCEKVEMKKVTTYNEVAECLVRELARAPSKDKEKEKRSYDEKNIRRRVYDALNVLMAMGIISKEKKRISWIGLPGGVNDSFKHLATKKQELLLRLKEKEGRLSQVLVDVVCFKNLLSRNRDSNTNQPRSALVNLPFILITTQPQTEKTEIQLEMNKERTQVFFNFSDPFTIKEDKEVMKDMGLETVEHWNLPRFIPRELAEYYPSSKIIRGSGKLQNTTNILKSPGAGNRVGPSVTW